MSGRLSRWLLCLAVLFAGACAGTPAHAGGFGLPGVNGITLLVRTGDPRLDLAERYALAVLGADYTGSAHAAAVNYYGNPWIRDSFAWGTVPSVLGPSLAAYSSSELRYWLARQQPYGGWLTAPKSGYFDETPILISAVLNGYQVTGDLVLMREALPRLERGWNWLWRGFVRPTRGSRYLIWANAPPHVAADWVDQVGRHGYATQLEALWYEATRSLGIMERLTGHDTAAERYAHLAVSIRSDINRLLWTTSSPYVYNAPAVAPFGHYRSWVGGHGYFELDSNMLCVLYGIATPAQSRSITAFVLQHQSRLLGLGQANMVPAKVVYGDYGPSDYALKHERLTNGAYQNGYWPTVGALAAMGFASVGDTAEARSILLALAGSIARAGDLREWFSPRGVGSGAPAFQWSARMFLLALYAAYLGVHLYARDDGSSVASGIALSAPSGAGAGSLTFHGRTVQFSERGTGRRVRLTGTYAPGYGAAIPGTALCAGCAIAVAWG